MTLNGHPFARSVRLVVAWAVAFSIVVVLCAQVARAQAPAIPPPPPPPQEEAAPLMPQPMAPVPPATEMTLDQVAPPVTLAPAPPGQGVIQRIVVEGTQRIEPDSVLSYLLLRQGQLYDPASADRSLKTLFDTGLVRRCAARLGRHGADRARRREPDSQPGRLRGQLDALQCRPEHGSAGPAAHGLHARARPGRRAAHHRALPPVGTFRRDRGAQDHPAAAEPRRPRLRDQRRPDDRRGGDQFHRQPRVFRCRSERADRHHDERVVEIPHHQRQLRSRPPDLRPRAASPVLSRARLRRFPGGVGGRRAHARSAGFLHHVHGG